MHIFSSHQERQVEVIDALEQQVNRGEMGFSTVAPVKDYERDNRICLTSVHFPHHELISQIQNELIAPLQTISPQHFFYSNESLHMTIKSIRVINDPPHFTKEDIVKAEEAFEKVIPQHKPFNVYFYRLLLFPNNVSLIGTTELELDSIVLDLDKQLTIASVPDDKKYINDEYFFSNMTLARFNDTPSQEFIQKVEELSQTFSFQPYPVDSITLVTSTAVFTNKNVIKTWKLRK